jgi:hypothetical protein
MTTDYSLITELTTMGCLKKAEIIPFEPGRVMPARECMMSLKTFLIAV